MYDKRNTTERCAKCKKSVNDCECREKDRSLDRPPVDRMMDSSRKDFVTK